MLSSCLLVQTWQILSELARKVNLNVYFCFVRRTTVLQSMQLGIDVNRHKVRCVIVLYAGVSRLYTRCFFWRTATIANFINKIKFSKTFGQQIIKISKKVQNVRHFMPTKNFDSHTFTHTGKKILYVTVLFLRKNSSCVLFIGDYGEVDLSVDLASVETLES